MSFITELADRLPSGSQQTRTRLVTLLAVLFVLVPAMTGTVVAAENEDFLCNGGNEDNKENFTDTVSDLLLALVVGGPVIGTIVAAFAQVAAAGSTEKSSDWIKTRKNALIAGWSVPILVYGMEVLARVVIGIDLSCIIP
jgi:heme A synthase